MEIYLVKFACYPTDTPKYYILDEKKHDAWCIAEPPEGYKCFETIWSGNIEKFIYEDNNKNT